MISCMAFVFLALCEFVIVKYIHWRKQRDLKLAEEKEKEMAAYLAKVKEVEEHNKGLKKAAAGDGNQGVRNRHQNPVFFNPYLEFYKNVIKRNRFFKKSSKLSLCYTVGRGQNVSSTCVDANAVNWMSSSSSLI